MAYKLFQVKLQVLALQFCFSATSHFRLQGSATCSIISKACAEARQTYPHMPAESTPDGETMSGCFDVFDCLIQFYSKRRYGSYILHILLHPNWFWKGIQIVMYYILLHPTTSMLVITALYPTLSRDGYTSSMAAAEGLQELCSGSNCQVASAANTGGIWG